MKRSSFIKGLLSVSALSLLGERTARAAAAPSAIRIGVPGVGVGNRPIIGGSSVATVALRGLLEEEFRAEGIKIQYNFLRGAGPAVNELFANGLADFGWGLGDLPSIIGKAGGLKTRILAAGGIRQNSYLAVPADSPIQGIKDLRGKKVAIFKGTNIQLAIAKILDGHKIAEKDLKAINLDNNTARLALTTKDIEAVWGNADLLQLRDQGVAKIVFTTRDADPRFLKHSSLIGSQSFIDQYPEITQRVVNKLVEASKWLSDQEANPAPVYQLWAKSGTGFANYKEDFTGSSIKVRSSPLLDEYFASQYKRAIADSKRFGLIKNDIAFDSWVEPRFLNQALKTQKLEGYWQRYGEDGKPKA
jgi:sulfonate transport system substrate-binding protein